jgi:hypothetical protein
MTRTLLSLVIGWTLAFGPAVRAALPENCPPPGDFLQTSQSAPNSAQTNAPPQLEKAKKIESIGCQRTYDQTGHPASIDSFHRQDAEKLREVIRDVPDAVSELNTYQKNRRSIQNAAYVGTVGALLILAGIIASNQATDPAQKKTYRYGGLIGGLSILGGTLVYSVGVLRGNEEHLNNAVRSYNQTHPEKPIALQFSTGLVF